MGAGDVFVTIVVVGGLSLLLAAFVSGAGNPVSSVADELVTSAGFADVDAEVAKLLATVRRAELRMAMPGVYSISYKRTPGWAVLLAVLTFPIGLLFLFVAANRYELAISVTADGDRTRIRVFGRVHRKFAEAIGAALDRRFTQGYTRT